MTKTPTARRGIPALKSRNYQLFFAGQGISLIGTWMTQVATVWLVYQLTNSALLLGVVGFIGQVPSLFLSPFGGVLVDRLNTRKILITTQVLAMGQSLALAVLALTHTINIWHILFLSLFQGVISALDAPARQTFVPEMVERKADLASAIALNSSLVNGGRLIGPAIAGVVIARVGSGYCFLIDGLSYIAVIAALLAMRLRSKPKTKPTGSALARVKAGFIYAFGFPPIRAILQLLALFSFVAMPYVTLLPIFATKILKGDAHTLGFIMAASGIGALFGGAYLSTRKTVVGLGNVIVLAPAISGVGIVAFAVSRTLWFSLLMCFVIGLGSILLISSSNILIQTLVEDDKRGRVMSIFTMSFLGIVPFGNLLTGILAERIGATNTLVVGGALCIAATIIFSQQLPALRRIVRPVYQKIGLLPSVDTH